MKTKPYVLTTIATKYGRQKRMSAGEAAARNKQSRKFGIVWRKA